MAKAMNKAGRPLGSGTPTKSRRERIRAAAQERDRLAAEGDQDAIALKAQKMASKEKSIAEQEEEKRKEEKMKRKKRREKMKRRKGRLVTTSSLAKRQQPRRNLGHQRHSRRLKQPLRARP